VIWRTAVSSLAEPRNPGLEVLVPRRNLYRILGVPRDVSPEGLRRAYRRLAKDLHPDHGGDTGADGFRDVQAAYDVLSDPDRRRRHDHELGPRRQVRERHAEPLVTDRRMRAPPALRTQQARPSSGLTFDETLKGETIMSLLRFGTDPFDNILRLQRALTRAVDHPMHGVGWTPSGRGVFPPLNIFEGSDGDSIVVVAEIPGIDRDSLQIETLGNRLALAGERDIPAPEGDIRFHRRERQSGEFRRVFRLPFEVDPKKAEASYSDGVLKIRLEKAEAAKARQIAIKS
jgi:HSP20 family protein